MRFNRQTLIIAIVAGLAVVLLYALSFANRTNPRVTPQGTPQGTTPQGQIISDGRNPLNIPGTDNRRLQVPQQQLGDMQKKAQNIDNQVEKIRGVDEASVLVVGNTCLVGYRPSQAATNTNTMKNVISERVKAMDKSITNVVVSDSADIMSRINRLSTNMGNNGNIDMNQVKNEMNEIMRSVSPVVR